MAGADYITCARCKCRICYDGDVKIRQRLEDRWGDPSREEWLTPMLCPTCIDHYQNQEAMWESIVRDRASLAPNVAFNAIKAWYKHKRTARSKVLLMNHIVDGIHILDKHIGRRDQNVVDAYCLHPMFQSDDALRATWLGVAQFSPLVMLYVMEYRNVANNYLAPHHANPYQGTLHLSPLEGVNQMLVADKVQNYYDFRRYHAQTHKHAATLDRYFHDWFMKLGITEEHYQYLVKDMPSAIEDTEKFDRKNTDDPSDLPSEGVI